MLSMGGVDVDIIERSISYRGVIYPLPATTHVSTAGRRHHMQVNGDGWEFTATFRLAPLEQVRGLAEYIQRAGGF